MPISITVGRIITSSVFGEIVNILFLYEKLNLCIDYIGRDNYSVVKDNINKISTEAIYYIENDPSLYFIKNNIEKN